MDIRRTDQGKDTALHQCLISITLPQIRQLLKDHSPAAIGHVVAHNLGDTVPV